MVNIKWNKFKNWKSLPKVISSQFWLLDRIVLCHKRSGGWWGKARNWTSSNIHMPEQGIKQPSWKITSEHFWFMWEIQLRSMRIFPCLKYVLGCFSTPGQFFFNVSKNVRQKAVSPDSPARWKSTSSKRITVAIPLYISPDLSQHYSIDFM